MATAVRRTIVQDQLKRTILILYIIVLTLHGVYGQELEMSMTSGNLRTPVVLDNLTPLIDSCESFHQEYIKAARNFTDCELLSARPFRMCRNCIEQYAIVSAHFRDLNEESSLEDCKTKYLKSDRVQIIPTIQKNIEDVWGDAVCEDYHVNGTTREVNYILTDNVSKFLELFRNFSDCINASVTINDFCEVVGNTSSLCAKCKHMYVALNKHYNAVMQQTEESICMDMADMINCTRRVWSLKMNCTHRSADSVPVIIISCVVALTPLFFYTTVKITGKVRKKTILPQKRLLGPGQDALASGSHHANAGPSAGGGDASAAPQMPIT